MSLSDFSDLTDISSDEEDIPLAKRAPKAKAGPKEYKITRVLRPPRTAQYTAKSLYDQIIENAIDLDPEYQRDVVWQEEKQSGLIDSVLRNYYIPPIIFAVTIQDDGSELRTCIDGKQRLTSIQRFIDGQIPHKDSFTNEKLWFKSTAANSRRKLLPQYLRTQFTNKQIVCVEYTELNSDQEREIFQRVQLGVALTPAERLQALVGPWSGIIREIQSQVLGEEGFEGYLDWGHARGRDFQCLATIGYLIENHPKTAIPGPKTLEKWLQKAQPVAAQLRMDLHETFRIFITLARDKKYSGSLNRPTRVSPIEFVMIGVLIYLKRQTLSLTQISSAIEKMRKDVRASHKDIRSNTRITKHLTEFMSKKIKVSELKSDGEGDKPAAQAIAKVTKQKRKRPVFSDDSDVEPAPKGKPSKPLSKPLTTPAVKSSKQTGGQQAANTNKAVAVPNPNAGLPAKPSLPAKPLQTPTRKTNNSMSNLFSTSTTTLTLPTHVTKPSPSTSNNHPRPTSLNTARPTSVTIQTDPVVKGESPGSPMSPFTSLSDRLAPIRAAKASLSSGQAMQPSVSKGNEMSVALSSNTFQTPVDPGENPSTSRPATSQTGMSPPQQLPPAPIASSQNPSTNLGQARMEEVLRNLRSQYPQLGQPGPAGQDPSGVTAGTVGQSIQENGTVGHAVASASIAAPLSNEGFNNLGGQINGGGVPQGTYSEGSQQQNPQPPGPHAVPPLSNPGMSGNLTSQSQRPPNYSTPVSGVIHGLPQRPPAVTSIPRNSMRAEPLGLSRSVSSEGANQDGRREQYNNKDRRLSDDRRSDRYNHNPYSRHGNWSRPRS